jgi:hypothetical protein
MIFYHGTTENAWNKIQEEGFLFGVRKFAKSRCTYLTPDISEAKQYGEVILQVEYNPLEHPDMNNYVDGCWQLRVYEPIPLISIRKKE